MDKTEAFGAVLVLFAAVVLAGYGVYAFVQATDIPVLIRVGVVALIAGFLIILLSLVRERLLDIRRERSGK